MMPSPSHSTSHNPHRPSGRCAGCGLCADLCPFGAVALRDHLAVIDVARCMGCGVCVSHCPNEALTLLRDPARPEPLEIRRLQELYASGG